MFLLTLSLAVFIGNSVSLFNYYFFLRLFREFLFVIYVFPHRWCSFNYNWNLLIFGNGSILTFFIFIHKSFCLLFDRIRLKINVLLDLFLNERLDSISFEDRKAAAYLLKIFLSVVLILSYLLLSIINYQS